MSDSVAVTPIADGLFLAEFQNQSILDSVTIQRISKDLLSLATKNPKSRIVLDFANVRFLSSQTLGVLLTLRRQATADGTRIAIAELRPEIGRVFKITSLDKMFDFFPTRAAALKHFGFDPADEKE